MLYLWNTSISASATGLWNSPNTATILFCCTSRSAAVRPFGRHAAGVGVDDLHGRPSTPPCALISSAAIARRSSCWCPRHSRREVTAGRPSRSRSALRLRARGGRAAVPWRRPRLLPGRCDGSGSQAAAGCDRGLCLGPCSTVHPLPVGDRRARRGLRIEGRHPRDNRRNDLGRRARRFASAGPPRYMGAAGPG